MSDSFSMIRGRPPTPRPASAPKLPPLSRVPEPVDTRTPFGSTPHVLGEILGVRYGMMQGWEVVGASATQPPLTFGIGLTLTGSNVDLDPATPTIIGGLMEPVDGALTYVRRYQGGVGSWVASTGVGYTWGIGIDESPLGSGNIDLQPATPTVIGGIMEPAPDTGFQYTRSYVGGVGIWTQTTAGGYTFGIGLEETPPGSNNIDLLPATAAVIGGVSVVARSATQGLDLTAAGALTAPLATNLLAGSIVEPPPDTLQYVRSRDLAGVSTWQPATAANYIWNIGLEEDPTTPGTINLLPAQFLPGEIGGVTSEARSLAQGLLLDPATGHLTGPLATDLLAGSIVEPPPDTLLYVRTRSTAGVSSWVPSAGTDFGTGLSLDETATPPIVHLQPAGPTSALLGGVWAKARTATQGLELYVGPTTADHGEITVPLASDLLAGSIVEPAPSDTIVYARKRTIAGVSSWVPTTAGAYVGDVPPSVPPPFQGQIWFESDTGRLFVFYDDGNSTQWVQVGGP